MMIWGFDLHGVLNEKPKHNPKFFSELTHLLVSTGHEVHIITGGRDSDELRDELEELGIAYTHLFSITSYLEHQTDHHIDYDEHGNPYVGDEIWNKIKGTYCEDNKVQFHIDDTDAYLEHFTTPVARFYSKDKPYTRRVKAYGAPPVKEVMTFKCDCCSFTGNEKEYRRHLDIKLRPDWEIDESVAEQKAAFKK